MHNPQLSQYVELLKKWQQKVNLISPTTIDDIWNRHIEDSLQLAEYIPSETTALVDIGSGAGLPGIPLAIQTNLPTYLVESDRKKCLFLQEVARQVGLPQVKVFCERAESSKQLAAELKLLTAHSSQLTVTARALAPLTKLFDLIKTLLENNNATSYKLILPKGKNVQEEIEEARKSWKFDLILKQSKVSPEGKILLIENLRIIES